MQYKYFPQRPAELTPEFIHGQYVALQERIAEAENSPTSELWLALYADWNALKAYVSGEGSRRSHAFARDMANASLERSDSYFRQQILPQAQRGESALIDAFLKSVHKDAVAERYGKHILTMLQVSVEPLAPINVELRVQSGNLAKNYLQMLANGEVEVAGKRMTLAMAGSLLGSDDAAVRCEAFETTRQWYLDHREELAAIYDQLVKLRHQMALNLGHENFVRLGYEGMGRTDYGPKEVAQFRANVRRYAVPLLEKFQQQQMRELGTDTLKPWDVSYEPGLSLPRGIAPIETQLDKAESVFNKLSPALAKHFVRMRQEGLIDLENRRGKRSGAYCTTFADEGRVAILCNSTGDQDDVRTLMHEMGHAFQKWESQPLEDISMQRPTSDLAEVHSMGMEYLSMRYMTEFFGEEDTVKFRRGRWKKAVTLLCYVCVVDEFQHWVYENPSATTVARDQAWDRLWDTYQPGLDFTGIEEYKHARWYAQNHIFGMPFYYIDYALAETGAMQLALVDERDHEAALATYMELCRIGGSDGMMSVFARAGLRSPFDEATMRDLMVHAEREVLEGVVN